MKYFFLILCILLLFSCEKESIDKIENYTIRDNFNAVETNIMLDVAYGINEKQKLDLYLPNNNENLSKVIIAVHGGGWDSGDKSTLTSFCERLVLENPDYAIINLNYRLQENNLNFAFPNQFFDINLAIDFLISNSNLYHIKPEFALIGSSAGGHLSLMYDYLYDNNDDKVKTVISFGGPTNLATPYYLENTDINTLIELFLDKKFYTKNFCTIPNTNETYLKLVSPIIWVNETSSPTFQFHGNVDDIVPLEDAISLKETLDLSGIENELIILEGGHSAWNADSYRDELHQRLGHLFSVYLPID